jgi:hypothetical protein
MRIPRAPVFPEVARTRTNRGEGLLSFLPVFHRVPFGSQIRKFEQAGKAFFPKPFGAAAIAEKVNEVLATTRKTPGVTSVIAEGGERILQ